MRFRRLRSRAEPAADRMTRGFPLSALSWIALGSLAAICCIVALMLYSLRLDVTNGALTAAGNVAEAVAQDVERNFELLDLSLQAVRDGVRDPEVMSLPARFQREILFDRSAQAKDLGALLVLDEDGKTIVDSGSDPPRAQKFGDRDFFRVQKHQAGRGLFISRPLLSPFDGEWVIALSRRVDRENGSFGGVVVGLMKLAYFDKLFSRLNLGPNGSLTLMGADGTVLMRHPFDEHDIGRVISGTELFSLLKTRRRGSYEAVSALDGVRRIFRFQQVGTFPLIQNVGFSVRDLYAPWWLKVVATVMALALLCATILSLVAYLQIELSRRARAEAAYAQLAATDKLTGLPNRRRFDEILDAEWRRADRSGERLALLLLDVDLFKAYNDTYGHLGGDIVLAEVGLCVQGALRRPGDFAARYGGEEFVVLLPNTTARGAITVAERVRAEVAGLSRPHRAAPRGVLTVSIGVAALVPGSGQPVEDLLAAADLALYEAKAGGRNRTVLRSPDPQPVAA